VEGQGRRGDEHSRAALVPESQRDHRGSPHGQRELHEALRERVQTEVRPQIGDYSRRVCLWPGWVLHLWQIPAACLWLNVFYLTAPSVGGEKRAENALQVRK